MADNVIMTWIQHGALVFVHVYTINPNKSWTTKWTDLAAVGMASQEEKRSVVLSELRRNVACKRILQELSGSLGDLGTFIPIVVALALANRLDLGTSFIATGIYNVVTGLLFGVPMAVQPMKSIAAVALAEGDPLSVDQIMAAGICVSGITLLLGLTGLIRVVAWLVPVPVVRGIQLAQGLSFAIKAIKYVVKEQDFSRDKGGRDRPWLGLDGLVVAVLAFCFIVLVSGTGVSETPGVEQTQQSNDDVKQLKQVELQDVEVTSQAQLPPAEAACGNDQTSVRFNGFARRVPSALIVFGVGVIFAFIRKPRIIHQLRFGPSTPQLAKISARDWKVGFMRAGIPQLPLTVLNSVVAVCKLSKDLFPAKDRVSPTSVSVSVGLMNLIGCWFGALPVCHGAGGLAGQYRFGATSGLSVVMLGSFKLVLGLVLGSSLIRILGTFPVGLLGILLLFSGVELAMACRDQSSRFESFVMLSCVAVSLGSSLAIGCVSAMALFAMLKVRERATL